MKEKAILFHEATSVISPIGSGQIHFLFMQKNTKVLEIVQNNFLSYHAIPITRISGVNYFYNTDVVLEDNNLVVDINKINTAINFFEIR